MKYTGARKNDFTAHDFNLVLRVEHTELGEHAPTARSVQFRERERERGALATGGCVADAWQMRDLRSRFGPPETYTGPQENFP